jgi:hypothetical protein
MKSLSIIFLTGYAQVLLVSANTYFISRTTWLGIAVCGFGISWLWTINVRKVTIGSKGEQFTYATGAMLGGLTGVMIAKLIKQ